MKIKINDFLIILYFLLLSFVLKDFYYIPLGIAILIVLFAQKLEPGIKNLIYIFLATTPFMPFFVFFIFYIPFIVFGTISENASFIKKYLIGFSVIHVLRLVAYYAHTSILNVPLTKYLIIFIVLIFLSAAYLVFIRKNGVHSLRSLYSVDSDDYRILLATLFFLFFVANVMYNDTSLHGSNATQIYAKQFFIIDTIDKYHFFPQYDPKTGLGEELFLTDSPTHFTKYALILSTLFLRQWFSPLLIYNAHSMFILWMVILGSALLLKEVLSINGKNNSRFSTYFIILGSIAIGISFQFVRILESLKSFSAHPINLLLLAMILSKPKKPAEFFIMAYLMVFSYMVHVIQAIGAFVFAISLFIVVYLRDKDSIKAGYDYVIKNKMRVFLVVALFIGIIFAYTTIGLSYNEYVREHQKEIFLKEPLKNMYSYIKTYLTADGTSPFSIKYPDLRRLDTKESGFFLSFFGAIAFAYLLINFKNEKLKKARIFAVAFVVQFLLYMAFTNTFNIGNLEPGYRIIHPYTVVLLSLSIAAVFDSFRSNIIKAALLIVFFAFLFHSLIFVRINLSNIHSEQIISEGTLKNEMDFVRTLPIDGRFITYGLFANAVDAGMAHNTQRYFTRYQYNIWTDKNNIYNEIVHTTESFGNFPGLNDLSGLELRNYFKLAGYKYLFLNICHPAGNLVATKIYPNYSTPLYQNQCLVFLRINNTNYAEEVTVLKNFDNNVYKGENGYKYFTLSRLKRYGFDAEKILEPSLLSPPIEPIGVTFNRLNPHLVVINGDFEDNEWVTFKEEYFPRWKAYMGNTEVPIYPTNFNLMLINTIKGNSIVLKYDLVLRERILNFVSLIAVLICSLVFILLLKYELF